MSLNITLCDNVEAPWKFREMFKEKYLQGNLTFSTPLAPAEKAN